MTTAARVVYDYNTLLQALASPDGPSGQCIQLALDGKVDLYVSPVVFDELRDVAGRPKVTARLQLTLDRTEEFLEAIQATATVLVDIREAFVYERDPDDAHYINLAAAADASMIVSRDKDLLDLMDSTKPQAAEFRERYPQLRILDPVSFLREIGEIG